jgi:hypothetical protein
MKFYNFLYTLCSSGNSFDYPHKYMCAVGDTMHLRPSLGLKMAHDSCRDKICVRWRNGPLEKPLFHEMLYRFAQKKCKRNDTTVVIEAITPERKTEFHYYQAIQILNAPVWYLYGKTTLSKQTPWPQSATELYRRNDCRLSTKLVPPFAGSVCRVVGATDPYHRILGLLNRSRYFFVQVAPQLYSRG